MSEEPDIIAIRVYLSPRPHTIKTVCVVGTKAPDPAAIGSEGDRDTVTCKAFNGIQHAVLLKDDPPTNRQRN